MNSDAIGATELHLRCGAKLEIYHRGIQMKNEQGQLNVVVQDDGSTIFITLSGVYSFIYSNSKSAKVIPVVITNFSNKDEWNLDMKFTFDQNSPVKTSNRRISLNRITGLIDVTNLSTFKSADVIDERIRGYCESVGGTPKF